MNQRDKDQIGLCPFFDEEKQKGQERNAYLFLPLIVSKACLLERDGGFCFFESILLEIVCRIRIDNLVAGGSQERVIGVRGSSERIGATGDGVVGDLKFLHLPCRMQADGIALAIGEGVAIHHNLCSLGQLQGAPVIIVLFGSRIAARGEGALGDECICSGLIDVDATGMPEGRMLDFDGNRF